MKHRALVLVSAAASTIVLIVLLHGDVFGTDRRRFSWTLQGQGGIRNVVVSSGNTYDSLQSFARSLVCNESSRDLVHELQQSVAAYLSEQSILTRTQECSSYLAYMLPDLSTVAYRPEDMAFPLAFSFSAHHEIGILETLLALVFRPTDSYCFHVDAKAEDIIHETVEAMVQCYQQEFPDTTMIVIKRPIAVYWGSMSVLDADLMCMRRLREQNKDWKMYLNPASTELPIVPITEMRRRLASANGSVVDSQRMPRDDRFRWVHPYVFRIHGPGENEKSMIALPVDYTYPPYKIHVRKGSKNVALRRDFVDFILDHPVAWKYRSWIMNIYIPDEHFYSTLATLTVAQDENGGYLVTQDHDSRTDQGLCVRYSDWHSNQHCHGKDVHSICNFAVGDLPRLDKSNCLMANKFSIDVDSVAIICQALRVSQNEA